MKKLKNSTREQRNCLRILFQFVPYLPSSLFPCFFSSCVFPRFSLSSVLSPYILLLLFSTLSLSLSPFPFISSSLPPLSLFDLFLYSSLSSRPPLLPPPY
uniref:Transmembrane protein n=1 Tax=Cacopsylla melanoneura TaxID=428564 RepID=A0A8D8ZJ03_9HEMI